MLREPRCSSAPSSTTTAACSPERFGAPASQIKDIVLYAHSLDLKLFGLSFYVGSQAAHADMWAKGVRTLKPIIEDLLNHGITLDVLNIGGGFPVHYDNHKGAPSLHDIVVHVHNALHELPYMPKIMMEPGRGLVATTTVLVSEVVARSDRSGSRGCALTPVSTTPCLKPCCIKGLPDIPYTS